jgi:two-component system, OmpR family, alkaline phosphatase synthesis response regulator PhoP
MPQKILVVEDDIEMVELLRFNLKIEGYAVGTAIDGVEALKKARSIRPDLILLDLMLPELDGFAVCNILRRDPKSASIPIIILTAISSQLSRFNGLDAGANAYITKPFSHKYLLQCIQELLPLASKGTQPLGNGADPKQRDFRDPAQAECLGEAGDFLVE